MVTLEHVRKDPEVDALILQANAYLRALEYTEHGRRHAGIVADGACKLLTDLGHDDRTCELAGIAGYLHDAGNAIHRQHHALGGSVIALRILERLGMPPAETTLIANAIGNHEEERGYATTPISAALNIADKADVHRSRVQADFADFDIHDRVNYATTERHILVDAENAIITLDLTIDTEYAQVIEYFEIFLDRMRMVKQAAEFLGCHFRLVINDTVFS